MFHSVYLSLPNENLLLIFRGSAFIFTEILIMIYHVELIVIFFLAVHFGLVRNFRNGELAYHARLGSSNELTSGLGYRSSDVHT